MTPARRPMSLSEELRKLPNILTVSRIVMIPPVMFCMGLGTRLGNFIAVMIFTVAAITDWLDGWLARRQGLESLLGKFLDPLADKLIVQAILVMAAELGRIPGWFVVLLLSREIAITGLRAIASSEGLTVEVSSGGKYKTAFQLVGLVGVLLHETFRVDYFVTVIDVNFSRFGLWMLALSAIFSLQSAWMYFRGFARAVAARAARHR